ncbi:MAG: transcription antitermination factor NusB [Clostridia bacterium]|nr:transcription antitermination factor NusB [Clostridia bacterium]
MSRKTVREHVYKLIFEYLFSGTPNPRTYAVFSASDGEQDNAEYMQTVYYGVIEKYDELKSIIIKHAEGFSYDRIFKPDLAALLLSIYEMKYMPDIPNAVSINEAVELVKTYSTDKSHVFVNGVLASVNKELSH